MAAWPMDGGSLLEAWLRTRKCDLYRLRANEDRPGASRLLMVMAVPRCAGDVTGVSPMNRSNSLPVRRVGWPAGCSPPRTGRAPTGKSADNNRWLQAFGRTVRLVVCALHAVFLSIRQNEAG